MKYQKFTDSNSKEIIRKSICKNIRSSSPTEEKKYIACARDIIKLSLSTTKAVVVQDSQQFPTSIKNDSYFFPETFQLGILLLSGPRGTGFQRYTRSTSRLLPMKISR